MRLPYTSPSSWRTVGVSLSWLLLLWFGHPQTGSSQTSAKSGLHTTQPKASKWTHDLGFHFSYVNDHSGVDTGIYPELRYRMRYDWWLDLEAGFRWGPPSLGNQIKYHLMYSMHLPLPHIRTFALQLGLQHSSYMDIQRGENAIFILNHLDSRYFSFRGGLAIRFPLTTPTSYLNPFHFQTEYVETNLLFDVRGKLEFQFAQLGGSTLQVGLGIMDFILTDIFASNTVGYQLFALWKHPKWGSWEFNIGMMSYSFLDLAGFYGRFFTRLSYTYRFGG